MFAREADACTAAAKLIAVSDQAFVDAMMSAASVAAIVALVGAFLAAAFLPSRARGETVRGDREAVPSDGDLLEPAPA